jgi:hypothetical protein
MMKAKIFKHLVSFDAVRRKDWNLKISVYQDKHVMLLAQHRLIPEQAFVKHFSELEHAASFIDFLIEQDFYDSQNF